MPWQSPVARSIVDAIPSLVYIKEFDGTFAYVNRAVGDLFGVEPADIIGRTVMDILDPHDAEVATFGDEQAMQYGKYEFEFTINDRLFLDQKSVLSSEGRMRIVGIATDITELRLMEREIQDMRRIDSLGKLAQGVIHDFRHITSIIRGHVRFIERDLAPDDGEERRSYGRLEESFSAIRAALAEGDEMIDGLMDFSRMRKEVTSALSFNQVIRELTSLLRFPTIEVTLDLGEDTTVRASREQLRQVLMNLAFNARDAMPQGGRLRISTFVRDNMACLAVRDTGHGIPADLVGEVLKPYVTTKPRGQGTGLGLPTVCAIVEKAGGDVSVASEEGVYTEVTVALPVIRSVRDPK